MQGSPPLVRERLIDDVPDYVIARITPARAGKTTSQRDSSSKSRDHPRSCGKDKILEVPKPRQQGSPPLVRERPRGQDSRHGDFRITPARAGKTFLSTCGSSRMGDHPRSCGKDKRASIILAAKLGSPPLVRERQHSLFKIINNNRITPARAGKTFF